MPRVARGAAAFAGARFEVLVVDNGSAEPPEDLVARFPGMRLVAEPTHGPGPARNRGITLARATIIAFLNSDCIADPEWSPAIIAGFAATRTAGSSGGR